MEAISGTYNIIDPDVRQRDEMTRRACGLIERAHDLGTQVVTLCTGTCHPNNMWHPHPGNDDRSAWQAMTATLEKLLAVAEAHNVTLGIEPERANVINSAVKARRILDQMQSKRLAIVLDGANLFDPENVEHMQQVLTEAIDLLGSDIAIAHAKDIPDDPAANHRAAGTGRLDWLTYLQLMHSIGFDGPLILHGLLPSQVSASIMFLQQLCTQISCNSSKAAINDA